MPRLLAGVGLLLWLRESDPVTVGSCRGDGLVRDRSSGTHGESGEGGSGHSDQPPDSAGGGNQGIGGATAD